MRLITHVQAGEERLGALWDDLIIDVNRATAARLRASGSLHAKDEANVLTPNDIIDFLAAGADAIAEAQRALAFVVGLDAHTARTEHLTAPHADAAVLCPVPRPPKIICVGRNYAEHAKEAGFAPSETPILFARFASTLVPQGGELVRPSVNPDFDWEGELAVVIGKHTSGQVAAADAYDYVAGYSIFNDATVRPYQFRTTQYTAGKNFRASGPFGPTLVLKDEVPDPGVLDLETKVNDEVMQSANTSDMLFDVPTIIESISEWIDLEPGDVIPMGTPAGVGFKRSPPVFLKPGDTVTVTIEKLGTLSNPVVAEERVNR